MRAIFSRAAKIPLFIRVVSLYVVIGVPIALIQSTAYAESSVAAVHDTNEIAPVRKDTTEPLQPALKEGTPKRLIIPRLSIDLPIIDGEYNQKTDSWALSDYKAHFATMTDKPNDQSGSTLIYGHNTTVVFAPLIALQRGDTVKLRTNSKHTFVYTYKKSSVVPPNDTSVVTRSSSKPQLVLMTCNGIWSESRRVMFFDLKEVE